MTYKRRTLEINAKNVGHSVNGTAGVGDELGLEGAYPIAANVDPAETREAAEVALRQGHQTIV